MKKILITGTTGFLGSRILVQLLLKKYFVTDLIRTDNSSLKKLRKKYSNYNTIFIDKKKKYLEKIKDKKFSCFIHLATLYKKKFDILEINNLLYSNCIFPYEVIKVIIPNLKKIINFGSYMEYQNNIRNPQNIYAASKIFFEETLNLINNRIKIYNIKLHETFDFTDSREKILPTLIHCFKKNKKFELQNKKIALNFVSIKNIFDTIKEILNNKITPGTYFLKNNKDLKIYDFIKKINLKLNKKIKFKVRKVSLKKKLTPYILKKNYNINFDLIRILKSLDKKKL